MQLPQLKQLRKRADLVIKGAETWAPKFRKQPKLFKKLVKVQSSIEDSLLTYFSDLGKRAHSFVNWRDYMQELMRKPAIRAAELTYQVEINFDPSDAELEQTYLTIHITDDLIKAVSLGAQYAEEDTGIVVGASDAAHWVQKAATDHVGKLVTDITETTRSRIEQSIQTSLTLGESIQEATDRLRSVIDDAYRAEMIARTETVGGWGRGVTAFGKETNATGKSWHTSVEPCPICQENEDQGEIGFEDTFSSGDEDVPAHPNCQCYMTLSYANGEEDIQ